MIKIIKNQLRFEVTNSFHKAINKLLDDSVYKYKYHTEEEDLRSEIITRVLEFIKKENIDYYNIDADAFYRIRANVFINVQSSLNSSSIFKYREDKKIERAYIELSTSNEATSNVIDYKDYDYYRLISISNIRKNVSKRTNRFIDLYIQKQGNLKEMNVSDQLRSYYIKNIKSAIELLDDNYTIRYRELISINFKIDKFLNGLRYSEQSLIMLLDSLPDFFHNNVSMYNDYDSALISINEFKDMQKSYKYKYRDISSIKESECLKEQIFNIKKQTPKHRTFFINWDGIIVYSK